MAEFKNVFIKSKMNKDLDDRLLPQGEYRNALNIQVSKSESSDVGALENVLGNNTLVDFSAVTSNANVVCIGYLVSEANSCVFFFLTDNKLINNPNGQYKPSASNFIVRSVISQGVATQNNVLVQGAYLNFWEGAPIYGVNLLEQLLFWTDNRNQPRKINIESALNNVSYYVIEDTISVAKYMPYNAPILWEKVTANIAAKFQAPFTGVGVGSYQTTMQDVVSKKYPNGGTALTNGAVNSNATFGIDSVAGYILPGSTVTGPGISAGTTVVGYTAPNLTVSSAQTIANNVELVFSANPYYDSAYRGDPDYLEAKFVRFSYRFKFDDGEYSVFAPFTQECFIPQQDGYFLFPDQNDAAGDVDNNDMSAAYRSTIVEFMENKVNELTLLIDMPVNGDPAFPATTLLNTTDYFKITEIEILFKESDGAAVLVVDTISAAEIKAQTSPLVSPQTNTFQYVYSGTKPFRTLPEDQLTRVYDKVPVKALGQEVISNRVVYSNFQTKHTPPSTLSYNVGTSPKQGFDVTTTNNNPVEWRTSIVEYPNHTLKQNRNYQAGFVLSDRFGRTTSTLLSNAATTSSGSLSKLSTVYSPYNENTVDIGSWPGDALFVQVNETINKTPVAPTLYPGIYVGNPTLTNYNPLGFETWKVVVKQQEQDYYNVYLPGILAAYPEDDEQELGLTSHVVLLNDNINKVPRDLAEVGPDQKQFRSSVQLFGRVQNTATSNPAINTADIGRVNEQYYPSRFSDTVSTIQDEFGMFNVVVTASSPVSTNLTKSFYEAESNPLIGRISTTNQIGQINPSLISPAGTYDIFNLAVYETEPVESKLDIYWETSTSGKIDDLNAQVEISGGQTIFQIKNFDWYISEYFGVQSAAAWDPAVKKSPEPGNALAGGPAATSNNGYSGRFRSVISGESSLNGAFYFEQFNTTPIEDVTLESFTVIDGAGNNVTSEFDVLKINGTANGGPGKYVNYRGQDSLTTGYAHDSFIMVNKSHRVFLGETNTANTVNSFAVEIVVSDTSLAPNAPLKTFSFPNGSNVNDVELTDLQTIHVGGRQLIGNSISWGQTSQPIRNFLLPQPDLTDPAAGLFFEYGYEEGLSNTDLVKFYGMNGANSNNNGGIGAALPNQQTLQWSIDFQQQPLGTDLTPPIFEINPNTGVLKEIDPGEGFGLYNLKILLTSDDPSLDAFFNIKITIGRKTTDGSFSNNLRDLEPLQYDSSYVFNLHNTLGAQNNFGAYDNLPGGSGADAQTTFKKVYPNIANIYTQTSPTLNEFYRNEKNGGYVYAQNTDFQRLNLLQPSGSSSSEGALTQGTGYINIEMILAGRGSGDQEDFQTSQISWAVEYREVNNAGNVGNWKAATDIEGNILSWNSSLTGSKQINPQQSGLKIDGTGGGSLSPAQTSNATHNAARPNNTGAGDQRQNYGAGSNEDTGIPVNDNPANTVQYRAQRSSNSQSQTTALIGKWAVVGESPIYGNTIAPPCFGEYRVIIQNIGGECDTCQSTIVGDNPNFPNQDVNDGRSSQDAGVINIGDFYYDLKPLNAPRAYGYYVNLSTFPDTPQGKVSALNNDMFPVTSNPSVVILYAEEGVNRYVSQFYTDPGLTEIVTINTNRIDRRWGGSGGNRYVQYTAVETGGSNYNVPYSVNIPDINNPPPPEDAQTPNLAAENAASLNENDQYKRLWACRMNTTTGRKEAKSSVGRAPATP